MTDVMIGPKQKCIKLQEIINIKEYDIKKSFMKSHPLWVTLNTINQYNCMYSLLQITYCCKRTKK